MPCICTVAVSHEHFAGRIGFVVVLKWRECGQFLPISKANSVVYLRQVLVLTTCTLRDHAELKRLPQKGSLHSWSRRFSWTVRRCLVNVPLCPKRAGHKWHLWLLMPLCTCPVPGLKALVSITHEILILLPMLKSDYIPYSHGFQREYWSKTISCRLDISSAYLLGCWGQTHVPWCRCADHASTKPRLVPLHGDRQDSVMNFCLSVEVDFAGKNSEKRRLALNLRHILAKDGLGNYLMLSSHRSGTGMLPWVPRCWWVSTTCRRTITIRTSVRGFVSWKRAMHDLW